MARLEFFLPIVPPTVTHQDMRLGRNPRTGKLCLFKSERLRRAERLFSLALGPYRPEKPFAAAVKLTVVWRFPRGRHRDGSYKATRPDTDNLEKTFKDVLTRLGFWKDDALVAVEHVEKVWSSRPGIFVRVEELDDVADTHRTL